MRAELRPCRHVARESGRRASAFLFRICCDVALSALIYVDSSRLNEVVQIGVGVALGVVEVLCILALRARVLTLQALFLPESPTPTRKGLHAEYPMQSVPHTLSVGLLGRNSSPHR